jgi:ankyrin repeat protein
MVPNLGDLHRAVLKCDIPAIQSLLDAGADPSAIDMDGMTPLHWAVYGGYVEVAELLLRAVVRRYLPAGITVTSAQAS